MKQRIWTGIIGGVLFLFFVIQGGLSFAVLISLLAMIAYVEFLQMARIPLFSLSALLGFLFLIGHFLPYVTPLTKADERWIIGFVFFLFIQMILSKNRFSIEQAGSLLLGTLYISFGFSIFIETRFTHGLDMIFFILLIIWATDTGAYFVGRKLGKHKLWPAISPNKSIEGSLGGLVSAIITAILLESLLRLWADWIYVVGIASLISILGQIGDLAESSLKRHYQVKDSGNLLPGHGGVLDRFDSILFVFPILYILQLI